ncbi:TatD family hydrolase [Clostridium saccharoperbutylacetonicum]|uniref:TatD family hydrolase n=1 Tax=Clostridium saccharoperbutylacetonicum TaxID=36745 RepID=UPI000983A42D|nr:TatD family hydrolase [Clostridium saccharoperbutylacetonicum]AQR95587.1 Tat-linked quality control protein TatD [Clostridium saccharoperbutylacetonicum]NSB31447.1 TatD DNase family protein [Clostridium saccharoperbutylacetonicum]
MKYIDFHIHMDFYKKPQEIINIYEEKQIYSLFVTNLPEIYEAHLPKYNGFKYIRLGLGYHPEMVDYYDFNRKIFDKYFESTNYIGEVGIDGSKKYAHNIDTQIQIFDYICSKVSNEAKIMTIHSKKAEDIVLQKLKKYKIKYAVFHWYSGSLKTINDIVESGYYFSINPSMLESQKGKEILKNIPHERILFESDGPFSKYKKNITEPKYFEEIFKEFNEFYGIDYFEKLVFNNLKKLLVERQFFEQKSKILKQIIE